MEGDEFDVALADLPGAGYLWTPAEVPDGLSLVETAPETLAATEVVGSARNKVLRFQADQAGDYEIVFIFARPWENVATRSRTVRVRVRQREPEEQR
jgi:inhibitor of cysteine peptidase